MISILVLGLLFGIRHAFDADHLAAVATLAARSRSVSETVRVGLAWGLGHALTLFTVGAAALIAGVGLFDRFSHLFELAVGIMLIALGADVVRSAVRNRIHVHRHRHGDHTDHVHFHAHTGEAAHDPFDHRHAHPGTLPRRAAVVGLVHGLAGSAALVLFALGTAESFAVGLGYLAVFGLGSVLGMAALSMVIAVPLRSCAEARPRALNGLRVVAGLVSVVLGVIVVADNLPLGAWMALL
jgi:ABC-type nickel/cobalt efflux system permease component RcnA